MKKFFISMLLTVSASSANAESVGDFSLEQYQQDLDVLVPLASSLRGECLMGDRSKCVQSDSLMRLIRQHAIFNPSGETLSPEEAAKSKQEIVTKAAEALSTAFEQTVVYSEDFQVTEDQARQLSALASEYAQRLSKSLDTTEVTKEIELLKSQIITNSDK
ncbi:hypothetical protein NMS48_002844 [Vibrio cholerae]|nr:hypothetical protein [Vibrio cholerae]EJL6582249.1 hypothetical protein [Vibrio cholerae]EKF9121522.1 hypothetical protein [Vibrio cholerae]HCJ7273326.1 hypothetical protein [Vibrio cholerae]HCJ7280613.1 hypothetical protein [Vibrio cholerae]